MLESRIARLAARCSCLCVSQPARCRSLPRLARSGSPPAHNSARSPSAHQRITTHSSAAAARSGRPRVRFSERWQRRHQRNVIPEARRNQTRLPVTRVISRTLASALGTKSQAERGQGQRCWPRTAAPRQRPRPRRAVQSCRARSTNASKRSAADTGRAASAAVSARGRSRHQGRGFMPRHPRGPTVPTRAACRTGPTHRL